MRQEKHTDLGGLKKYEKKGHHDTIERSLVMRMQEERAAGNDESADEALDDLLRKYWYMVDMISERMEELGYNRNEATSVAAMGLAYLIGTFDLLTKGTLQSWVSLYLTVSFVEYSLSRSKRSNWYRQAHRTGFSGKFWQKVVDERSTQTAQFIEERAETLWQLVNSLDPRLRTIIAERYWGDPAKTLEEVEKLLGLTGARVQQLEALAIETLRKRAERSGLRELARVSPEELQYILQTLKGKPAGEGRNVPAGDPGRRKKKP